MTSALCRSRSRRTAPPSCRRSLFELGLPLRAWPTVILVSRPWWPPAALYTVTRTADEGPDAACSVRPDQRCRPETRAATVRAGFERQGLERKAEEFYKDALRNKSKNKAAAKTSLQRILKMVPASSPSYKKAAKLLSKLG